jgi:hypothetical protein
VQDRLHRLDGRAQALKRRQHRFDPDSRQVISSERVTPLYRADSRG